MKHALFALALLLVPYVAYSAAPISPVAMLGDPNSGFCTAFFVSQTLLVTAGHCIVQDPAPPPGHAQQLDPRNLSELRILPQGAFAPEGLVPAHVAAMANPFLGMQDWAILQLDHPIGEIKPIAMDCDFVAKIGDYVTYQGFPGAQNGSLVTERGYIDTMPQTNDTEQTPQLGMTLPVSGGASGSPLMHDGKVIGVITAINPEQPAWSYAQPIAPVCAVLKDVDLGNEQTNNP